MAEIDGGRVADVADVVPTEFRAGAVGPTLSRPYGSADAWQRGYRATLVAGDFVVILASTFIALALRFGANDNSVNGVSYTALSLLLAPVWLGVLTCARAYEMRFLGVGEDEYRRVAWASWWLMAVIAVVCYSFKIQFARGYVAIALPLGTILLLLGRYLQRKLLHSRRKRGRFQHRLLAVGGHEAIETLASELAEEPYLGLQLVGACLPAPAGTEQVGDVPVMGSLTDLLRAIAAADADTVAITTGPGMSPEILRQLSWDLEGTGIDIVVAPALLDVAGPRIVARPVAGLPFLHVEKPELSGPRQFLKATVEWVFASVAFLLIAPIIAALCLAIRMDSPGRPVFRQARVGRGGREFTVYKLRTMYADAESLVESLREHNDVRGGMLFKIKEDPRITRLGKWLRRWSLDELPQLWNVVRGDMALVGPRPPLPSEVSQYDRHVSRRLLVRPGITGLWQVSGRSNLSWTDSVRLDLYYIENWSLALDALIVWKTVFAVFRREGAY
jgi:exopolysaccharide biosynthesis polyprenyl glycosylphosphotransferase